MRKFLLIFVMFIILPCFILAQLDDTFEVPVNSTNQTINITNFFPKTFNLGDSQMSIQVQNIGNEALENIIALVTGEGFSTYEITPIDTLGIGDKSYIILSVSLREGGNITLTIKIMKETFYQNITITDQNAVNESKIEIRKREKIEILNNLTVQLSELEKNYTLLESEIASKKDENYDVSQVSLGDLKNYIRSTESSILSENADSTKVNLQLAAEEYLYQKNKLDNAPEISRVDLIKNYALIFTTITGAFIMIFTLYELLKRKGGHVVNVVGSVKSRFRKKEK